MCCSPQGWPLALCTSTLSSFWSLLTCSIVWVSAKSTNRRWATQVTKKTVLSTKNKGILKEKFPMTVNSSSMQTSKDPVKIKEPKAKWMDSRDAKYRLVSTQTSTVKMEIRRLFRKIEVSIVLRVCTKTLANYMANRLSDWVKACSRCLSGLMLLDSVYYSEMCLKFHLIHQEA